MTQTRNVKPPRFPPLPSSPPVGRRGEQHLPKFRGPPSACAFRVPHGQTSRRFCFSASSPYSSRQGRAERRTSRALPSVSLRAQCVQRTVSPFPPQSETQRRVLELGCVPTSRNVASSFARQFPHSQKSSRPKGEKRNSRNGNPKGAPCN